MRCHEGWDESKRVLMLFLIFTALYSNIRAEVRGHNLICELLCASLPTSSRGRDGKGGEPQWRTEGRRFWVFFMDARLANSQIKTNPTSLRMCQNDRFPESECKYESLGGCGWHLDLWYSITVMVLCVLISKMLQFPSNSPSGCLYWNSTH